jgi:hypothetical protein
LRSDSYNTNYKNANDNFAKLHFLGDFLFLVLVNVEQEVMTLLGGMSREEGRGVSCFQGHSKKEPGLISVPCTTLNKYMGLGP